MTSDPPPLPKGWVLADRFIVERVLGRGGFGIAYLAEDRVRSDQTVVKELAPVGVPRDTEGRLDLDRSGTSGHALRHRFLEEAETLRRLRHAGIPGLRAAFVENGTAYHVTGYLAGSQTLESRLRKAGRLPEEEVREIFVSILDILEAVHAAGVLHRDIKPSNVLLGSNGEVMLIDFGAAREWIADSPLTHTVIHTPGYAPPEQLSEKAPRGPATDLYALCATAYHALAGTPPATANDRLGGLDLRPLVEIRPEIDPAFGRTIEMGLALRAADRPQSVDEMRTMLRDQEDEEEPLLGIEALDEALVRLRDFRFDRRACPSCQDLLIEPRPLRLRTCPVCRGGVVRLRDLDERRCPACRLGRLTRLENEGPLAICPCCGHGLLTTRRKSLLSSQRLADCPECGAHFEIEGETMRAGDEAGAFFDWRTRSGRGRVVHRCSECEAQFDEMADGRWRAYEGDATPRYPEEWARIAARLSPSAGNAACDACDADYWLEEDRLTLLGTARDPFGYASHYRGRSVMLEDVRWLGVGKTSGGPGLLCEACGTEFDRDGEYQRLTGSPNRRLTRHLGEPRLLEDWHRLARGLPTIDQEEAFHDELNQALADGYRDGQISFDGAGMAWRGKAVREEDGQEGTLMVDAREVSFGGRLRRWRAPLDAVLHASASGDRLRLTLSGYAQPVEFEVLPIQLTIHLRSGDRELALTAEELADRLRAG